MRKLATITIYLEDGADVPQQWFADRLRDLKDAPETTDWIMVPKKDRSIQITLVVGEPREKRDD